MKNIRNFSIIVHIDYGESMLSDHIIQICGDLSNREMEARVPSSMGLKRERGITTRAQSMTLDLKASDGETYQLNFIDAPGHVDFLYKVSRLLATCEGALLVIDAKQGAEAQTLINCYTAMEMGLEIVPVLNKIGPPAADPERTAKEIEDIVGIDTTDAVRCSAKAGVGVADVLKRLVRGIPSPGGDPEGPLQVLIIDSWFDSYLGAVSLVCIKDDTMRKDDKTKVMGIGRVCSADRLDIFTPKQADRTELKCSEIGRLVCTIKSIPGVPVGDTPTQARNSADRPLPGFKKVKPQVCTDLFPMSSDNYENFRDVLGKLSLNDASLFYEPKSSTTLGFGFRCGFLGLLRIEIVQERLEREYDLNLITTAPTIVYEVEAATEETIYVDNPSKLPSLSNIYGLRELIAECHILLPQAYLGNVITLCIEKRGVQTNTVYHDNQVALMYETPMAEVVLGFLDRLKSTSCGYAPLDYNFKRFWASDMVRVDVLINNERIDVLALVTHRDNSQSRGRELVERMKGLIPHQQSDIVIQVAIGTYTIVRSTVKQLCKNVLTKCYGGDISRKKKLLQKQREGKKHMKQISSVELPQETFLAILRIGKDSK